MKKIVLTLLLACTGTMAQAIEVDHNYKFSLCAVVADIAKSSVEIQKYEDIGKEEFKVGYFNTLETQLNKHSFHKNYYKQLINAVVDEFWNVRDEQLAGDVAVTTCMELVEGTDFKDYKYNSYYSK